MVYKTVSVGDEATGVGFMIAGLANVVDI